jgi:hypothetical protein
LVRVDGFELAAVVVVSVAAVVVALLWALVRIGQQPKSAEGAGMELVELSADEEFAALQAPAAASREALRRQVVEAAERSRRGQDCE